MQAQNNIDFSKIDWGKIDKEKAEFIYYEAIARLDSIHKNNEVITNKALSMLSFSVPILTALVGYFILQWGTLTIPLQIISFCSVIFLFVIFILLLHVIIPEGFSSAQGGPSAYFTDGYYLRSMEDIFKGNIQDLHSSINEDIAVQKKRAYIFKAAVLTFAFFPIILVIIWLASSFLSLFLQS